MNAPVGQMAPPASARGSTGGAVARASISRAVARAVHRSATAAGVIAAVSVERERDWASALFEGARVTVEVIADAGGFDAWLATLSDADLPLAGYFIASAEVTDRPAPDRAIVELLAIAET